MAKKKTEQKPVQVSRLTKKFIALAEKRMKERGLTVAALRDAIGSGNGYTYRVFKLQQNPTLSWIEKVAKHLRIKINLELI